ncbi:MAG: TIM barrel protein [Nanoarchaeota archaeon]|nr:TIM barrel protein [Nanoarchaeota archaeon]
MKRLFFGTAGIPISTVKGATVEGIKRVKSLGLGSMELEFVRSIYLKGKNILEVKKTAEKEKIILTAHAPYYINLNSNEKKKIEASKKRILDTAKVADAVGAYSICFHGGYYMKQDPRKVLLKVKKEMKDIIKKAKDLNVWIRLETTGKKSSFGTLDEILELSREFVKVLPCIDFAHLYARSNGKLNGFEDFKEVLAKVEKSLGKKGLKNMHCHASGIAYSEKGEKHHLVLAESKFDYRGLCKALKEFNAKGVLISESPNIEKDALKMKKFYESL